MSADVFEAAGTSNNKEIKARLTQVASDGLEDIDTSVSYKIIIWRKLISEQGCDLLNERATRTIRPRKK